MTIRGYLRRRAITAFCAIVVADAGGLALFSTWPKNLFLLVIAEALIFASIPVYFIHMYRTPCPRCLIPMGWTGVWIGGGKGFDTYTRCPHCGVSVDERMGG